MSHDRWITFPKIPFEKALVNISASKTEDLRIMIKTDRNRERDFATTTVDHSISELLSPEPPREGGHR